MKIRIITSNSIFRQDDANVWTVKQTFIILSLLLAVVAYPVKGRAAMERYVLDFDDLPILGYQERPATLHLKRAFQQQHPRVDIADLDLKNVVLVAKSRAGAGVARLRVGDRMTWGQEVEGRPAAFRDNRNTTFDRVHLPNPSYGDRGPWTIELLGNFIVRKVVLEVEDNRWRRHHNNKGPYSCDHRYRH